MNDLQLELKRRVELEDLDRENIAQIKDLYYKLTGNKVNGCLCSYAVRQKIHYQTKKYIQEL